MRRPRSIGLAFAALLQCAGCARPAPKPPAAAADPAADESASVSLERRPCFGSCPVYLVTLRSSGEVRFEGRRFVRDTGLVIDTVPKGRVDSLFATLERAGFFVFDERYTVGEPACRRYATDLPTVVTELHLAGRTRRVEHDHGCAEAPQALSDLEQRIDEVAGTARHVR